MQEEETALLSIGAVLEWKVVKPGIGRHWPLWETAEIETNDIYQTYEINGHLSDAPLVKATADKLSLNTQKEELAEHWYNTVAEAKAACEFHAATGQFPPGVEMALPPAVNQAPEERLNQ